MNNRTCFINRGTIRKKIPQFLLFSLLTVAGPCLAASFQAANVEQSSSKPCVDSHAATSLSEAGAIQQSLLTERQPATLFTLMPARYQQLRRALEGFQRTGVPLVASDGTTFYGAGFADDLGEYYLVPKLASLLHLKLATAVDVFLGTILCLSFFTGLVGFFFLFRRGLSRTVALIGLFLLFLGTLREGDVYVVLSSTAVALVPWLLYFVKRGVADRWFVTFASGAGLCAGSSNLIRSHSGTGFMLFMAVAVLFALRCGWRSRIVLMAVTVAAFVAPSLYFRTLRDRRDAYLNAVQPAKLPIQEQHPFWHSVYIGFGFLSNEMVPAYSDEVAIHKVAAISPGAHYLSAKYEGVLKDEVFSLIRHHLSFVVLTLAAKLGVICFALLLSANAGLLAAALYPKTWPIELAFWVAIAFSSLFGILVVPYPKYLLGFIAFATLYGVVSVDHALEVRTDRQVGRVPSHSLRRATCAV